MKSGNSHTLRALDAYAAQQTKDGEKSKQYLTSLEKVILQISTIDFLSLSYR
jgi:hypothetical protein